jgi:N utilization substance protein B
MEMKPRLVDPREAREAALKFLYQCEMEKVYFYSESHFNSFLAYFPVEESSATYCKKLVQDVFSHLTDVDQCIQSHSANWSLARMSVVDRSVLRLAVAELNYHSTPFKVVLNEAIDLAKQYGSSESSAFVNGILDSYCTATGRTPA